VTGGSGFVGRRLLAELPGLGRPVMALRRDTARADASEAPGVTRVRGDLLDPATYIDALRSCDTVLHLAAATGNATAAEHDRVNHRGTVALLDQARTAGVRNFLFVSSIAVTFPDTSGYHYAIAKTRAEDAVRSLRLRFLIVRPTMILGPGAPLMASLEKLALLPVAVLPGNGRARVQPIHVDEVARCLVEAVQTDMFNGETLDLGGPETLTMADLFRRIRMARRHAPGPMVTVPLPFFRVPLRAAETIGLGPWLPITAGQLSSFRFDGLGSPNPLQRAGAGAGVDEMMAGTPPAVGVGAGAALHQEAAVRAATPDAVIDAECRLFTAHLTGHPPDAYVTTTYRRLLAASPALHAVDRFDGFLVRFARAGALAVKLADGYAALFARASLLRRKMVLLLAILETRPPFSRMIDAPLGGGPAGAVVRIGASGLLAIAGLAAGTVVLLPIRLAFALLPRGDR
jgi:NADH dehydrogenase